MSEMKPFLINFTESQLKELKDRAKKSGKDVASLVRDQMFKPQGNDMAEAAEIYKGGIQQMQFLNGHLQVLDRDLKLIFNEFTENFNKTSEENRRTFADYHRKTEQTYSLISQEIGQVSTFGKDLQEATKRIDAFEGRFWAVLFSAIILSGIITFSLTKFLSPERKLQKEIYRQQQILNEKHNDLVDWISQARKERKK